MSRQNLREVQLTRNISTSVLLSLQAPDAGPAGKSARLLFAAWLGIVRQWRTMRGTRGEFQRHVVPQCTGQSEKESVDMRFRAATAAARP
jgi:hypothetical protein